MIVSVPGHDCAGTCSLGSLSAATGGHLPDLFVEAQAGRRPAHRGR
nr:hypothetical protein [Actinoplanes polyasparticus]